MKLLKSVLALLKSTLFFKMLARRFQTERSLRNDFFDLAPIDAADQDGLYQAALEFAMRNPTVRNVAITGPYGSGKTSVIKTFEKNSSYRFLNVSLATFSDPNALNAQDQDPEKDVTVRVERSILQQMLYGAGAGTLPYSRFKRISRPRWIELNAILFVGWAVAISLLYKNHDELLKAFSSSTLAWPWIFTVAYTLLYLARLISKALRASHSISVKKLSLQSGSVELDGIPESSILNKHLDEIIYFFEENHYDLVVFEDLDRFGNPEIFIKLREINKIINDRPQQSPLFFPSRKSQPLKFFYAIKDDIFFNKDRAKFFDFIVPIIPVINNSNSREILKKCIHAAGNAEGVSDRFIGEVALYLDDVRLIKNISNEFFIYEKKIGSNKLNFSKLLAAIIYKNAYPKDFENLHYGNGALFEIVQQRTCILTQSVKKIDSEIESLRNLIADSEEENCKDIIELIKIFWGHLCSTFTEFDIISVYAGDTIFTAHQILEWNNFEQLFKETNLAIHGKARNSYYNNEQKFHLSLSFRALEETITPGTTFVERHKNIINKAVKNRIEINLKIENLKEQRSSLARQPLYQLLNLVEFQIGNITESHQIIDSRLLNYLIRNGYLDETYHLYISIFHEGRMSRNDWDFILAIRDFRTSDPTLMIDNPSEVIEELREEDFGSGTTLNVNLIDYQLDGAPDSPRMQLIINYLSKHLPETNQFFEAYWLIGKHSSLLTQAVATHWPGYGVGSIDTPLATQHIARIIAHLDPSYISSQMNADLALTNYISAQAAVIFSENLVFEQGFQALGSLGVKIEQLKDISGLIELFEYVHQKDLYRLSVDNVRFLLTHAFAPTTEHKESTTRFDPEKSNYTAIRTFGSAYLKAYVDREINNYLRDVACVIEGNVQESPQAILSLVNHPKVDESLAIQFILQQDHIFSTFDDLPTYLWDDLLYDEHIAITWVNILRFHAVEGFNEYRLNEVLNRENVFQALSEKKIPQLSDTSEQTKNLSWFIVSNTVLSDKSYRHLCKSIPFNYMSFPNDLPEERLLVLADLLIVRLNEKSFAMSEASTALRKTLIIKNFETYKGGISQYPLSPEIKGLLLASPLPLDQKCYLLINLTVDELNADASLVQYAGQVLGREDLNERAFDLSLISYCLTHVKEKSKRKDILYNFVDILSAEEILSALSGLDYPYSDLSQRKKRPKLENTEQNRRFAESLNRRNIISSIKDEGSVIRLNTYR
ncbi:hypothetical protein H7A76_15225 [Pseudomonas sp. MSSRFD41]|uniref:YobI family P-loop NTPase n=1 Tax=Pseudomonas sp. MSSRFD41 TaxID=1310370 RepID=UPI00163B33F2|nr:hypothetical protein [Pseudomonas sp. MSSRFD41]MBC2656790.1 hypothetical protein [Pseudomonas sp. MSSRFD41]